MTISLLSLTALGLYLALTSFVPLFLIIPGAIVFFGCSFLLSAATAYLFILTLNSLFGFRCKNVKNNLNFISENIVQKRYNISFAKSTVANKLAFIGQMKNVNINDDDDDGDDDDDDDDFKLQLKKALFDFSDELNGLTKYLETNKSVLQNQYYFIASKDFNTAKIYNKTYSDINDALNFIKDNREYILKYLPHYFQIKNNEICLVYNIDFVIQNKIAAYEFVTTNRAPLLINNQSIDY